MQIEREIEMLPQTSFKDSYYFKVIMGSKAYMTVREWEDRVYSHRITKESVDAYLKSIEGQQC